MITVDQLRLKVKQDVSYWEPIQLEVATHVTENLLAILDMIGNLEGIGTDAPPHYLILAYEHTEAMMKTAQSLKTFSDWVIQNFEPAVKVIYDREFNNVMGGFTHGAELGVHRRITLDEAHNRFYTIGAYDKYKGATLNCVSRFFLDGSPDEVFNTNSANNHEILAGNRTYSGGLFLIIQNDGKIIVAGYDSLMQKYGTYPYNIMFGRINQDGTLDTAYLAAIGTGLGQATYYPRSVAIQPDQKIIFTGDFWEFNGIWCPRVVRINPDGSHDAAFQAAMGTGFNQSIYTILLLADGKMIMAGDHSTLNDIPIPRVFKLNADGSRDEVFNANVGTALNGTAYWGFIQPDGKIVLVGYFTLFNGTTVGNIVRLNPDGTFDAAFHAANGTGFNSGLFAVALQADGKILCGGNFTSFNGVPASRITRLNSDGSLDTAYNTALGAGFNAGVSTIVVQSDGRIIAAGSFNTFDGVSVPSGIIRLMPNPPSNTITSPW